jgi:hypothetical protein
VGLPFFLLLVLLACAVESASDERYPSLNEPFAFRVSRGTSAYDVGQLQGGWYVERAAKMDLPHAAGRIRPLIPSGRGLAQRGYRP